ncbi:MAG: hypothetical protein HOV80_11220 [Polyangiaceae bacterium]|nr:hypothetical protein [Polyangiaceae bacterium]
MTLTPRLLLFLALTSIACSSGGGSDAPPGSNTWPAVDAPPGISAKLREQYGALRADAQILKDALARIEAAARSCAGRAGAVCTDTLSAAAQAVNELQHELTRLRVFCRSPDKDVQALERLTNDHVDLAAARLDALSEQLAEAAGSDWHEARERAHEASPLPVPHVHCHDAW